MMKDHALPTRFLAAKEHIAAEPQSNTSRGEGRGMYGRGMRTGELCLIPLPFIPLPLCARVTLPQLFLQTEPCSGKSSHRARILMYCSALNAKRKCSVSLCSVCSLAAIHLAAVSAALGLNALTTSPKSLQQASLTCWSHFEARAERTTPSTIVVPSVSP